MHGTRAFHKRGLTGCGRALAAAMAFVMYIAALIPPGTMPGQTADGQVSLVLCTHTGLQTLSLDAVPQDRDGGGPSKKDRSTAKGLCAFAAVQAAALAETPVLSFSGGVATRLARPLEPGPLVSAAPEQAYAARAPPVKA